MDPNQQGIEHSFLKYPQEAEKQLAEFRAPKSLLQLRAIPAKTQEFEFELLSHARIPQDVFYLNSRKSMDRYSDIWAYEHSRVKIPGLGPKYYLNGNEVRSLVDNKVFTIFSQAPVAPFDNFWEAAYYKNVSLVVMLCMFNDPRRGKQSERYWPNEKETVLFSSGNLKVTNQKELHFDEEFVEREFLMEGPDGARTLKHYHWMGWSDLKKPVEHKMERFEEVIEACLEVIREEKMLWIHCSAGIGRTGTLGGILEAVRVYEKDNSLSIFSIVENMRKYRYHAVQTEEQYRFLYSYLCQRLSP